MKFLKVISNNVVLCVDNGQELILMGKGIGFDKKKQQAIDMSKVEKTFALQSQLTQQNLVDLLRREDISFFETADKIIQYAQYNLNRKLDDFIYVLLTDHLAFASHRAAQQIFFQNPLLQEIKILYPQEYAIGEHALSIIKKHLHVTLLDDEAGFIALHLINASHGMDMYDTLKITQLVHDTLIKIATAFNIKFDESALDYLRLLTHLNFFAQRVIKQAVYDEAPNKLTAMIIQTYPEIATFVASLAEDIRHTFDYTIHEKEQSYLIIHIQRILS